MKKSMRVTIACCLFFGLKSMAAHGSEVKLRNCGFEKGSTSKGAPRYWFCASPDACGLDKTVSHSGATSFRIEIDDSTQLRKNGRYWTRYAMATQSVRIKPNTVYTISAWCKAVVRAGEAGLAFRFTNNGNWVRGNWSPVKFFPISKSEREWKKITYTLKSPENSNSLKIMLAVEGFSGSAWFDDVSISEGVGIPAVPICVKPPVIDGKISSGEWNSPLTLDNFLEFGTTNPAPLKTIVRLVTDNHYLYIAARCEEPNMKWLKSKASVRDGATWADDSVEIFIDAQRNRSSFYQFVVNANGVVYDAEGTNGKWSPQEIRVESWKNENAWGFEMRIPFLAMGYGPQEVEMPNKPMALAVFRNRHAQENVEKTAAQKMTWLVWPIGNYANPVRFFPVDMGKGGKGYTVNFKFRGYEETAIRPPQAWRMEDPLYEELMSGKLLNDKKSPVGFIDIGRFTYAGSRPKAFALQHGFKFHYDEIMKIYQNYRILMPSFPASSGGIDVKRQSFLYRKQKKYDLPMTTAGMMKFGGAGYNYSSQPDAPKSKYYYWFIDERVKRSFEKFAVELNKHHKDQIKQFVLGHEDHIACFNLYDALRKAYLKAKDPLWMKWEEEVKNKYGFGKFGMPKSKKEATPFERIAFMRWFLNRYNQNLAEVAAAVRKVNPGVKIVSDIDVNGIFPMGYERSVGTYDYITQQMLFGGGPYRQSVAFATKIAADLSKTPVRGGPHIEHYFVSLSPEEVNEVLSSVFRVGGASLNLWLIDWFGKTKTDYYGAPDRFRECLNVFKHMATMRTLKKPKADSAILYSNVNEYGRRWWRGGGLYHEVAFTMLGPRSRSWFNFVSDYQILDKTENLSNYKVLYVPDAIYQDDATLTMIKKFVKSGGTLVLDAPEAFKWRLNGTERENLPEELMGLKINGKIKNPGAITFSEAKILEGLGFKHLAKISTKPIPTFAQEACSVAPVGDAKVIACLKNSKPAIIVNPYGKGRVVTFTSTPFRDNAFSNPLWWNLFKALQKDLKCATDLNIWRFKFPMAKSPEPLRFPKDETCLTGNSYYWDQERITKGPNFNLDFKYNYSLTPDLVPEELDSVQFWSGTTGDLFDRKQSLTKMPALPSRKSGLDEVVKPWSVAWRNTDAFSINLNFEKTVSATELRLWVSGDIPSITIYAMKGDEKIQIGGVNAYGDSYQDVREMHLRFAPTATKSFIIEFAKRAQGDFYLSEVELWGTLF